MNRILSICSHHHRPSVTGGIVRSIATSSRVCADENEQHLTSNARKKYTRPPPIELKSVRTRQFDGDSSQSGNTNSAPRNNARVYALLVVPVLTFGLGVWQVRRREWKLELIKYLEERTRAEPIPLPAKSEYDADPQAFIAKYEYLPMRVRGRFEHSREVLVTMRQDLSGEASVPGAHVITPFVPTGDRADFGPILVNRGFVPYTHYSPTTRAHAQVEGECEIVGLLRTNEPSGTFTPPNKPPLEWHSRDLAEMSKSLGTSMVFLDARKATPGARTKPTSLRYDGTPIAGQTVINLKNDHFSYIITWFSLSALTSVMWWKRFARALF